MPTTWTSDGSQSGGPNSVQTLVSGAASGDTITLPANGTFNWGAGITILGTATSGSPTITNISSTAGILPGMSFFDPTAQPSFFYPVQGTVVSVTANTITVNSNSNATSAGNVTFLFGITLIVNKSLHIIGLGGSFNGTGASTTIIQGQSAFPGQIIQLRSAGDGHIEWSGIYIKQVANNNPPPPAPNNGDAGITMACYRDDSTPYTCLIHDNTFDTTLVYNYCLAIKRNGIIVWNNFSNGNGVNALSGISLQMDDYLATSVPFGPGGQALGWNTPSTIGTLDTTGLYNTYIERNTFNNGPTACINTDDNARVVFRNNTVIDSDIHAHGQDTSIYGVRHYEVYNNTTRNVNAATLNLNSWMYIRGGGLVVFGNFFDTLPPNKPCITLICQQVRRQGPAPCQTGYPANRQVGTAWSASSNVTYGNPVFTQDGTGYIRESAYIWNNTGPSGQTFPSFIGLGDTQPDACGNGLTTFTVFSGNMIAGSNQITGVSVTSSMMAPMGVFDPSQTFFPLAADGTGPHITAVSGTTITMSANSLATGSSTTLQTGWIIQGTDFILGVAKPGYTPYTYPHPLTTTAPPNILEVTIKGSMALSAPIPINFEQAYRPTAWVRF